MDRGGRDWTATDRAHEPGRVCLADCVGKLKRINKYPYQQQGSSAGHWYACGADEQAAAEPRPSRARSRCPGLSVRGKAGKDRDRDRDKDACERGGALHGEACCVVHVASLRLISRGLGER